jgi:transcriptional regulator with XRE-family HTH domain
MMRLINVRDLGHVVLRARRERGLTQNELAELAGVSRQWLAGLERGRSNPGTRQVLDTLNALDLSIHVQGPGSGPDDPDPAPSDDISLDEILRLSQARP